MELAISAISPKPKKTRRKKGQLVTGAPQNDQITRQKQHKPYSAAARQHNVATYYKYIATKKGTQ